jgi:hypothetical protein
MDFNAKVVHKRVEIKAHVERRGKDVIVHVPTLQLIQQLGLERSTEAKAER